MRKVSALVEIEVERPRLFASGCKSLLCGPTYLLIFTLLFVAVVVQSPSHVRFFVTPWTAAHQASLSLTISQSLPKFMSIALVMLSSHLILLTPPSRTYCPQSFPASGTFPMSQLFISDDQITGALTSGSVLPTRIQS